MLGWATEAGDVPAKVAGEIPGTHGFAGHAACKIRIVWREHDGDVRLEDPGSKSAGCEHTPVVEDNRVYLPDVRTDCGPHGKVGSSDPGVGGNRIDIAAPTAGAEGIEAARDEEVVIRELGRPGTDAGYEVRRHRRRERPLAGHRIEDLGRRGRPRI